MFGAYDSYPLFYDPERDDLYLLGEYPQRRRESLPFSLDRERYNDLLREAEFYRLVSRLPQQPSWASRAWSRLHVWVDELACRLRTQALRQPCTDPVA